MQSAVSDGMLCEVEGDAEGAYLQLVYDGGWVWAMKVWANRRKKGGRTGRSRTHSLIKRPRYTAQPDQRLAIEALKNVRQDVVREALKASEC